MLLRTTELRTHEHNSTWTYRREEKSWDLGDSPTKQSPDLTVWTYSHGAFLCARKKQLPTQKSVTEQSLVRTNP